jgi:hypothetical protein
VTTSFAARRVIYLGCGAAHRWGGD